MSTLMESWPRRHRITVDEYYRMVEVGLLAPDARVELIEGDIIDMAPIGNDHSSVVDRLVYLFVHAVGDQAIVRNQGPVLLDNLSVPEPDLALLKWDRNFYSDGPPTSSDTLMVVEVSDTTLRHDLDVKVPLYARHGIPEVWVVDVQGRALHSHRSPQGSRYLDEQVHDRPGIVHPGRLPEVAIDLTGIF